MFRGEKTQVSFANLGYAFWGHPASTYKLNPCQAAVRRMASFSSMLTSSPNSARALSIDGTYLSNGAPGDGLCAMRTSIDGFEGLGYRLRQFPDADGMVRADVEGAHGGRLEQDGP